MNKNFRDFSRVCTMAGLAALIITGLHNKDTQALGLGLVGFTIIFK